MDDTGRTRIKEIVSTLQELNIEIGRLHTKELNDFVASHATRAHSNTIALKEAMRKVWVAIECLESAIS